MEEFGSVTLRERVFRYPGVLQAIIVILYVNLRYHQNSFFGAKLHY